MFVGKGFDHWKIKLLTIFGFQDVIDVVISELEDPRNKGTNTSVENTFKIA